MVAEQPTRQIFVAYAYGLYDKRDYRKVYASLEKAFGVKFIFADEKITNMHILQKIRSYITSSDFSIFDISSWNPNVTLELGIAIEKTEDWYICFNPDAAGASDVPSDIRGLDRIQYKSFSDLEDKLSILLDQRYPRDTRTTFDAYFEKAQKDVLDLITKSPGLKIVEIAEILGINTRVAKAIVGQLVAEKKIYVEGKTRGAKYYLDL